MGFTKSDLAKNCEALEEAGVNHVLALRGDRPQHMTDEQFNSREFFYATDLVRHLKSHTALQIAGACYPEKHFESFSMESDLNNLKKKQQKLEKEMLILSEQMNEIRNKYAQDLSIKINKEFEELEMKNAKFSVKI